jgi:hypothetical protein
MFVNVSEYQAAASYPLLGSSSRSQSPCKNTSNHSGTGVCDKTSFPNTLSNIPRVSIAVFRSVQQLGVRLLLTDRKEKVTYVGLVQVK